MPNKRIFITRDLTADSIFKKELENQGFSVVGQSLIEFSALPFNVKERPDWVFFYSKNAVYFFLKGVESSFFQKTKIGAIGRGTAAYLTQQSFPPNFIGNGNPEEAAQQFLKEAKGQNVLFPRAKNSKKSIQTLLDKEIQVQDIIVYDNRAKKELKIAPSDMIVFTSPLNAKAYLDWVQLSESQTVIAIGETTKQALQKLGIKKILMPREPSEYHLAQLVKEEAGY